MSAEAVRLVETREGGVRIEVRAKPRARKTRLTGVREGALLVDLAAPPVDGAANAELVEALADALGVPKRDVVLVRGDSARVKLVEVRGVALGEVQRRLAMLTPSAR